MGQPVGRRRHEVLSFEDVRPTRSAQTNQDRDQGRGQEGGRGCYQNRQGRQERRLSQGDKTMRPPTKSPIRILHKNFRVSSTKFAKVRIFIEEKGGWHFVIHLKCVRI